MLLDQQLLSSLLLKKIDDDLKPIIAKTSSALQAWLLLSQHFQGPFPSPPVLDIMDITPSPQDIPSMDIATPSVPDHSMAAITHSTPSVPDHSMAAITHSTPSHPVDVITPLTISVVPSSCSSLHTATLWTSSS